MDELPVGVQLLPWFAEAAAQRPQYNKPPWHLPSPDKTPTLMGNNRQNPYSSYKTKIFSAAQGLRANLRPAGDLYRHLVLNRMMCLFGLAVDAEIGEINRFDRKNYFYPDLPSGYQTSQMDLPIVGKGHMDITLEDGSSKRIGITRAHLEQDAGKSLHEDFSGMSGIDLNRAGTTLLEIVSEPEISNAKEAVAYARAIHSLVQYLGVCDGNMAEGSFRCDCNVSVRPVGQKEFGTRTEIKNVNSFRFIERAINSEIRRQIELIEDGGKVVQQTRLYDRPKTKPAPCATRRKPPTTATSPALICCRW